MTVAELRKELRTPTGRFDERAQEIIRILLDSGADADFVERAAEAYLRQRKSEGGWAPRGS